MNTTNSIQSQILRKIKRISKGKPIFPADFKGMGTEGAIKMALLRLVKEEKLKRIAHGIYVVPKIDPNLGPINPSMEKIAEAIAERDHAQIRPAGAFALNKLGLSTQVPMNLVYITDGAPRYIKIGKRGIRFKPTTARNLTYRGKISGLVVQAFKELGPENVTLEMIRKIEPILAKEKPNVLMDDAKKAPYWIAKVLFSIHNKNKTVDGRMA
jgi:hypothetical protein